MNVLLLGNGFDLYHKLPTGYNDFLQIVDFLIKHYGPNMKTIADVLGNQTLHSQNKFIKECYDAHKSTYEKTALDEQNIKKLVDIASNNDWFIYLLNSFNKEVGWIDFEKEISYAIDIIDNFLDRIDVSFATTALQETRGYYYVIEQFDFFYEASEIHINGFSDWIMVKDEYVVEQPYGSGNRIIDKEKILSALLKKLDQLSEILAVYLKIFVENTLELIVNDKDMKRCDAIFHIDQAISFNYTNTYEKLYSDKRLFHLHGDLSGKIILGVNPDERDNIESIDTSLLMFKKYSQRAIMGTDVEYLVWLKEYMNRSHGANSLMIMGHSLDITDADILQELFEFADEITILYNTDEAKVSYISNLINMFGKEKFDEIRKRCGIIFWPLDMDFSEFRRKRSAEAWAKIGKEVLEVITTPSYIP